MKSIKIICLLLTFVPALQVHSQITFPQIKGYEMVKEYPLFVPANLWDYINGAADAYTANRFVDLDIAEYVKGNRRIKAEVYRHESPEHAFGIYSMERSPDYKFTDIGAEGYQEGSLVHFVSGPYYVKVVSVESGKKIEKEVYNIANEVWKVLGRDDKMPALLSVFPEDGLREKSQAYTTTSFLGHEFFSDVFSASYLKDGKRYTLFAGKRSDPVEIENLIQQYRQVASAYQPLNDGVIAIKDKYNGMIYIHQKGNVFLGTTNVDDATEAVQLLESMNIGSISF
ncbi:MAG: hypothetical protein JJU28_21530 [Cyclobacteriaceae bacterium]|nr:hypothetical protein [Cyclobacteriaceae bacterium]